MKNFKLQQAPLRAPGSRGANQESRRLRRHAHVVLLIGTLALSNNVIQADNILVNPGFEATPVLTGWLTETTEGWSINGANGQGKLYRTGANALWTQGLYGNGGAQPYYNMYAYQKIAAAPGSTFTADAWFSRVFVLLSGTGW